MGLKTFPSGFKLLVPFVLFVLITGRIILGSQQCMAALLPDIADDPIDSQAFDYHEAGVTPVSLANSVPNCDPEGTKEYDSVNNICICKEGWITTGDSVNNQGEKVYCNMDLSETGGQSYSEDSSGGGNSWVLPVFITVIVLVVLGIVSCCCIRIFRRGSN